MARKAMNAPRMGEMLEHLRALFGRDKVKRPGDSAVSPARQRVGPKPLAWLFENLARAVGDAGVPGCFWGGLRVVAADGTTLEVQDTQANRERFGIHHNQHGEAGYPQVKAVILIECGTRAPLGCALGRNDAYEPALFDKIRSRLALDMLMLADRAYFDYARWKACAAQAAGLLWRVKGSLILKGLQGFEDGSYLAQIRPSSQLTQSGRCRKGESMTVRVIEYCPLFEDGTEGERVRLMSTLLDPAQAPAEELVAVYTERWSEETGLDELQRHLRGPNRVLRSPLPDLVEQEWYGFLLAYYVVRATMSEAARRAGCAPRALSFVHTTAAIKPRLAFFPSAIRGNEKHV